MYSERSMFVTFNNIPINATEILEWYKRISLCNNIKDYQHTGFNIFKELKYNYNLLDENIVRYINTKYQVLYFLTSSDKYYSFPIIYSDDIYKLYRIRN